MNTPLGSIKVGIESIRFILENLFKSVIEKCTVHQMHFACQLAMTKEIQMVMGGLQVMKETTSILEYISSQFPSLSVDANSLAKAFVKARIKVDEEELIAQVIATENPLEYLDLIYHIQTIRNLVDTVIASGDKATAVVSNLRNYLQNSSSEERKQVNLRVNIETILTVFSHELKNKVDLQFKVPDIYVLGFENKLYQLWSNIIKNAIEAIEGQGELNIIYIEKPEYHSISIQNNGPKIDDEVLDNMFKKFYTTKGKQKGTGLGLSIVKRIINEHHGQVLVSSTNKLTTFEFLFPKNN
jgi:two-component system NtrC family sensor kinase